MGLKSAWNAISAVLTGQDRSAADRDGAAAERQAGQGEPQAASAGSVAGEAVPQATGEGAPSSASAHPGLAGFTGDIAANSIEIGENITLIGTIKGNGNIIRIAGTQNPQTLNLHVFGHDNEVSIGAGAFLQNLRVEIGSRRWPCSQARLKIGDGFSIASQGRFILPNSGNRLEIGDNCMFSANIVVRGGEYPHLIFDRQNGEYLDVSDGIFIGNHVWVGEGAFIGKSVTLPDECIVGTRSVVTRRFEETHCVIGGNPARVVKRGVQWIANEYMLEEQFPVGHAAFAETPINRINRAERERAEADALPGPHGPPTQVDPE